MSATAPAPATLTDPLLAAFCDAGGPEVFHAIVHGNQIWTPDPFDVPTIHLEARAAFAGLLSRAAAPGGPASGKTLLLLGEAGSGKTHLMRAFRADAHANGSGYCSYMQMTTRADNYARYVLSYMIDALEQPYLPPAPTPGLTRLAQGLLDSLTAVPPAERQRLCDDQPELPDLAPLVHRLADAAVRDPRFARIDLDLIRAVLYLLPGDGRIRPRVLKWLRCEDLSRHDRELLGDLVPRPQEEAPLRTIVGLGQLMAAVHQAALVLCVDQLEEMIEQALGGKERPTLDGKERWTELFRQAVNTLVDIADAVPTAVVVVACLEDFFGGGKPFLTKAKLDRLERDPDAIRLSSHRSMQEIEEIVARRLEVLYGALERAPDPQSPLCPFTPAHLRPLKGLGIREVLDHCRRHREHCVALGTWVEPHGWGEGKKGTASADGKDGKPPPLELQQEWGDFLAKFGAALLHELEMADLLGWAIRTVSAEMPAGLHFGAPEKDGRFVPVEVHRPGNAVDKVLVAVCDKNAKGGGLGKQIDEVVKRAGETPTVIVRSTAFPASPTAVVSRQIAQMLEPKGRWRRTVVENGDWRAMAAFRAFHKDRQAHPGFAAWQKESRPLSGLPSLQFILALDKLLAGLPKTPAPEPPAAPPPPAGSPKPAPPPPPAPTPHAGPMLLGTTRGLTAAPVAVEPQELTQHAAFLGGPGSGKTTAALILIEQLLLRGVPAVLIDRKGDLCRYADPKAWDVADADAARAARRQQLRQRIDVALFTPGRADGRPLAIPIVPPDLGRAPAADREQVSGYAAAGLAAMMGYLRIGFDPKLAILAKAIEVLAGQPGQAVTVPALQQLVEARDEALRLAVGGFDDKHYKKLAEDLLTLSLMRKQLLDSATGETLNVDALLGRGAFVRPGKTRLSVVSTQFLGDAAAVDFFLAQLLTAVDRWRSRNPDPSGRLQAVFLFDEADQYLPATGKQPATKAPMEGLLKRARSAGIGLFLATQSPGDFDYKCRDQVRAWLIGRVKETVAINKLKPMLEAGKIAAAKLPGQETGQFFLVREKEVVPIKVESALMKTDQLPEDRIVELARATRPGG